MTFLRVENKSSSLDYQLRLKLRQPYDAYSVGITPLLTVLLLSAANSASDGYVGEDSGGDSNGGGGETENRLEPVAPTRFTPEPVAPTRFTPERTEPTQVETPNPQPQQPITDTAAIVPHPAPPAPEPTQQTPPAPEPTAPTPPAPKPPAPTRSAPEPPVPARFTTEPTRPIQPVIPNPQPPQPPTTPQNQMESIDQVPTSINLRVTGTLKPGPTGAGRKIGELEITDDGIGMNTPSLTYGGYLFEYRYRDYAAKTSFTQVVVTPSKQIFEFRQNAEGVWELWLKAGLTVHANQTGFIIRYRVTSTGDGANQYDSTAKIAFGDHVSTSIKLHVTTPTLSTGATGAERKIGELEIIDDGLGTNTASVIKTNIISPTQVYYFSNFRQNAEGIWVPQTITRPPKQIFEFRQNTEGVWELWLKAGATIPTSQTDISIEYQVTSTGEGTQNYYSRVTIAIAEAVNVYENHPLTKPIYDASGDGTFALTQNYGDNALFRITEDGRIWWRAVPDYENPQDGTTGGTGLNTRDNIYQIEVTYTASDGTVAKNRLAVQVEDIAREVDFSSRSSTIETRLPYVTLHAYNLDPNQLQAPQAAYLIYGTAWTVPDTGPLIITWSLSGGPLNPVNDGRPVPPDVVSALNTQADNEAARAKVEAALAEIEAITNLKFIEVARDDNSRTSDFEFIFQNDKTSIYPYYGLARYSGAQKANIWLHASSAGDVPVSVLIHEIAHSLGLKHAAEPTRGWPSDPNLNSIMNGADPGRRLQEADIQALQFLYGAPGTPGHHILSRVSKPLQTDGFSNWVHFFNVNENIGTDTIILTPTDLSHSWLTDTGIIYSLPAGQFDNDLFTIDADDNEIRFKRSPDYENPHDIAGGTQYSGNNVYELSLLADFLPQGRSHLRDEYHSIIIVVKDVDESGGDSNGGGGGETESRLEPVAPTRFTPEPPVPARFTPERTEPTQVETPNPQPPQPPTTPQNQMESIDQVPTNINLHVTGTLKPGPTGAGRKIGELEITDDGLGMNTPSLTYGGYLFEYRYRDYAAKTSFTQVVVTPSKQIFEFRQNAEGVWELWLKGGLTIPTGQTGFTIKYQVTSTGDGANQYDSTAKIAFGDHVPTNINLRVTTPAISAGPTGTGRKIGILDITDDGLGINTPIVTGGHDLFEFRQNKEGGWELWLKAGLNIPTTLTDVTIDYRVTSTGTGTQHYDSTDEIIIGETVNIYENHPLTKPIYDAGDDGTFTLTQNYGDNALFRITEDGRIWWRAVPDYENPQDGTADRTGLNARDNIYQIEVTHTASDGTATKTRLAVQVADIAREVDFSSASSTRETRLPYVRLFPHDLDPSLIQGAQALYLLYGTSWAMPDTGPLIITWSLSGTPLRPINDGRLVPPDVVSLLDTQVNSEIARAKIEAALAEIEAVTNLKFIEVARDDSTRKSDFKFIFQNDKTTIHSLYGLATYPGPAETNIWLHASSTSAVPVSVLIHEIAHSLGLKHAAEIVRGWPSNPNLNSIMNGADAGRRLQEVDIEALQFLYGAPGTPGHQLLSRVSDSLQTAGHVSEQSQAVGLNDLIHFFNVNENISTDTVILVATSVVAFQLTVAKVIYSLPAGRFDNDLFTIDADDREIRFKRSPDYEKPHDGGEAPYSGNNVYELLLFRDIPPEHEGTLFTDEYHTVIIVVHDVDETIDAGTQADII